MSVVAAIMIVIVVMVGFSLGAFGRVMVILRRFRRFVTPKGNFPCR
jgi:hypothetical protein